MSSLNLKTTIRHRKIIRKRVFAEFVSSCLVPCDQSRKEEHKCCPQSSSDLSLSHNLKYTPNHKANRSKVIKSTKLIKQNGSSQRTLADNMSSEVKHVWSCCGADYSEVQEIHKHVAKEHQSEIEGLTETRLTESNNDDNGKRRNSSRAKQTRLTIDGKQEAAHQSSNSDNDSSKRNQILYRNTVFPWLPSEEDCSQARDVDVDEGEILLYYKYVDIENPHDVCEWQRELCRRLGLTGKIRIATEGVNGTVGGSKSCTGLYMKAVENHPVIQQVDFKSSKGSAADFPKGLQVGVHPEIVPMGVNTTQLSYTQAGNHLSADAFHKELETHLSEKTHNDTVFVDCRNFYESRIGQFQGALAPDIRKFSYWPEYVDRNVAKFRDKKVIMYCTGGIRCERGSAYLKSKGVCSDVLQLQGGIHRYMEKYPNGLFQGKLFVFDDRYSIASNDTVISNCFYCGKPWDKYQPCCSTHCHQLVLSCDQCRGQGSTACCHLCKEIAERSKVKGQRPKEECECTRGRVRIPQETIKSDTEMQCDGERYMDTVCQIDEKLQLNKEVVSNLDRS